MCNPPFFKSKKEAQAQTLRKLKGLSKHKTKNLINNFSGNNNELWCKGGELLFVKNYIKESISYKTQVGWFTSLISNQDNFKTVTGRIKKLTKEMKIINMEQGNKKQNFSMEVLIINI